MKKITKVFLSVIAVTFSLNSFAVEWSSGPSSGDWMQDSDLNSWDLSKMDYWDGGTQAGAESVIKKLNGKKAEINSLLAKEGRPYKIAEFRSEPMHNGFRPGVMHIVAYSVSTRTIQQVALDWGTETYTSIQVGEPYFEPTSLVLQSPDGKKLVNIGSSKAQMCDSPGVAKWMKKNFC